MSDVEWKTLQFNTRELINSLVSYFVEVMEKEEEKTIETMREELLINGPSARDASHRIEDWKQFVSNGIKPLYRDIATDYIESKVGIEDSDDELYRKAIIIALGGGPTYAGPKGRTVWDWDYAGQHPSNAKARYRLPASWKLKGNKWMSNAIKKMRVYFFDVLDAGIANLPDSIFYGNLMVL